MRIKLFSHTDMDGISPYILLRYYYPTATISYSFCNYGDINEKVQEFLTSTDACFYDYIYITDISVNEEIAEKLQKIADTTDVTIRLFDHHKTALELNKFDFCEVTVEKDGELTCGTKLFYQYLITEQHLEERDYISRYVKCVNDYDTWLWANKYHYDLPDNWNTLFQFYGRINFIENVLKKFEKKTTSFTDTDRLILEVEARKKQAYIKNKMNDVFEKIINGEKCVIVFAELYTNDVATALKEKCPNSDIQIVIGQRGISYRSRSEKDIDLGEFVKKYGGGGHAKAAGSQITRDMRDKMIEIIFD